MPWTEAQQRTARAVEHGWKPKGSAKSFTKDFAEKVISESPKRKRKTLGSLVEHAMKGRSRAHP